VSAANTSVAVVILNWNGRSLLEEFLPSVVQHSSDARIYVIDNGSTDDSLSFLKAKFHQVQIIELDKNYGFAGGYNRGLKDVNEDLWVLLNSDVAVSENWLDPMIAAFEQNPALSIAQPKILSYRAPEYFEYAGASGGWIDRWGYPFCRGRLFDQTEQDLGQYDTTTDIFWASGAAFFIRKATFQNAGGFDEDFFAHMEEIDLCWRVQNAGGTIQCIPGSQVYHLGGASLDASSPQKTYLNFRNGLAMLWKNSDSRGSVIPVRLFMDGIAGLRLLFSGQPKHCLAVIRAHWAFFGSIGKWSKARNNSPKSGKELRGFYKGSVVWQYFLRGKKSFREIIS